MTRCDELSLFSFIAILLQVALCTITEIFKTLLGFFMPRKLKNVRGQLALITGGSRGIGRAIAIRLAQEGCNIAIVNRDLEAGQRVADEIMKKFESVRVKAFSCDVSKVNEVQKLKSDVEASLGCVDILVNNAAWLQFEFSLLEGDDHEVYQRMMDTNVNSYFWTCRAFLPDMIKRQRGHIVGVSSLAAFCPLLPSVIYTTTKTANRAFMYSLEFELQFCGLAEKIHTTGIYPAYVDTNDIASFVKKYFYRDIAKLHDPSHIADATVDGILSNKRNVFVPALESAIDFVLMMLPIRAQTLLVEKSLREKTRIEFFKMKKMMNIN